MLKKLTGTVSPEPLADCYLIIEDTDTATKLGLNHLMGPLMLWDYIALEISFEKGLELEACLGGLTRATEDAKERSQAFIEKRKPVFEDG